MSDTSIATLVTADADLSAQYHKCRESKSTVVTIYNKARQAIADFAKATGMTTTEVK